jgi:23S rRNA (cytosine1962-C5)-methyltransferase
MLRKITLKNSVLSKLKAPGSQFKKGDIEDSIKSFTPGEWVIVPGVDQVNYIGFINPLIDEKYNCLRVIGVASHLDPLEFIKQKIVRAIEYRDQWQGYEAGSRRLFFGEQDGLSGLIIDQYKNINIIQINSAGIDKYREEIKAFVHDKTKIPSFLLDNESSRKKEMLAIYNDISPVNEILISESGFNYRIDTSHMQKLGYYYDHRENRLQLETILKRWNQNISEGLDLFSYLGSWSKHALRSGVQKMNLVDQGDLSEKIKQSFILDQLENRYQFDRHDVFKYLDLKFIEKKQYQLIISDPPAFAKSPLQKKAAIDGYQKLHQKILRITSQESIVVFASCTHYVNNNEFLNTIKEAGKRERKKLRLLSQGHQGFDHPTTGDGDSSCYIKSYIFYVESL